MNEIPGADAEVFPDLETGRVVARYTHPDTGEMIVEVHVAPDTARQLAFNLTRASIAIEEAAL